MSNARVEWNHLPEVPIRISPLWQWPPRPYAVFRWYFDAWFWITINMMIVGLAFASLIWFSPSLDEARAPGLWIGTIFLRNFLLLFVVAHGLHYWFFVLKLQDGEKKFDPRPYPRDGRVFTGGSQLLDNMFWALASGVTVWSCYEAFLIWSMANGIAPVITFAPNSIWFIAVFLLIPVWESFYFYWIHRALHTKLLYRFHALHHRNTDVGPWSGMSMHPVEHMIYFGTVFIHFIVPSHPVHVIFHLMFYALTAITTHVGYEGLWFRGRKRIHLGMFHHQIHHRYFEVNYGNLDVPWDKFFGTFHDGTPASKGLMRERLKRRNPTSVSPKTQ